jgi:hypothetical protein
MEGAAGENIGSTSAIPACWPFLVADSGKLEIHAKHTLSRYLILMHYLLLVKLCFFLAYPNSTLVDQMV